MPDTEPSVQTSVLLLVDFQKKPNFLTSITSALCITGTEVKKYLNFCNRDISKAHSLQSHSNSRTHVSQLCWMRAAARNLSVYAHRGENLRFDHVIVGGVEDVAPDDPHDALVHHGLVGRPRQPGLGVLLAGPEGGVGRH